MRHLSLGVGSHDLVGPALFQILRDLSVCAQDLNTLHKHADVNPARHLIGGRQKQIDRVDICQTLGGDIVVGYWEIFHRRFDTPNPALVKVVGVISGYLIFFQGFNHFFKELFPIQKL